MQMKHFPVATLFIIVLNGIIFAIGLLSGEQEHIIQNYGFVPNHIFNTYNTSTKFAITILRATNIVIVVTRISHTVIHFYVYSCQYRPYRIQPSCTSYIGVYAERAIGVPRYLLVYFTSGLMAALFHGAIASYILHNGNVVLIGASGAISGVLGIAVSLGNTRAYYWLVVQILFAVVGSVSALSIAFTAHIGGFIAGVVMTKALVSLERSKRKSKYFLQP